MSLEVLTQGGGGGESASILVTGLDDTSTVTATKDGKTINGKWNSTESRFEIVKIEEYGTWTVNATDGVESKTAEVLIDAATEFELEISYYLKRPEGTTVLMHFDGNVNDATGLNTPSVYGKAAYGTGVFGKAFKFNGSSCIKIPYSNNIAFGSGDFTIAGWFYLPAQSTANAHLVSHSYRASPLKSWAGMHLNFRSTSRKLGMEIFKSSTTSVASEDSTAEIPINTWVHIAMVRSGNTITLYINGVRDVSITFSGSVYQASASSFKIGSATNESAANDNPYQLLSSGSMVDEFFISKTAVWTDNFEPPTQSYR